MIQGPGIAAGGPWEYPRGGLLEAPELLCEIPASGLRIETPSSRRERLAAGSRNLDEIDEATAPGAR
jgi:hypothetical protein